MKWIDCGSCLTEFRVVSDSDDKVLYCPYCGDEIDYDDEDFEDEE